MTEQCDMPHASLHIDGGYTTKVRTPRMHMARKCSGARNNTIEPFESPSEKTSSKGNKKSFTSKQHDEQGNMNTHKTKELNCKWPWLSVQSLGLVLIRYPAIQCYIVLCRVYQLSNTRGSRGNTTYQSNISTKKRVERVTFQTVVSATQ